MEVTRYRVTFDRRRGDHGAGLVDRHASHLVLMGADGDRGGRDAALSHPHVKDLQTTRFEPRKDHELARFRPRRIYLKEVLTGTMRGIMQQHTFLAP